MSIAKWSRQVRWIGFVLVVASLAASCTQTTGTKPCRSTSLTISEKADSAKGRIVCVCDPYGCCCGPIGGGCTWD
jgi:hypothetical protein